LEIGKHNERAMMMMEALWVMMMDQIEPQKLAEK
jgi:hypothetical protein